MTTKPVSQQPTRSSALSAKSTTAVGTLVNQVVKLGSALADEALPVIPTRADKEHPRVAGVAQITRPRRAGAARATMRSDANVPPHRLKGKKYIELCFETSKRDVPNPFFPLVIYPYRHWSLRITSNKAEKDWPQILAGCEVIATAFLDRLLHSCHVLKIQGRRYRLHRTERRPETAVVGRVRSRDFGGLWYVVLFAKRRWPGDSPHAHYNTPVCFANQGPDDYGRCGNTVRNSNHLFGR